MPKFRVEYFDKKEKALKTTFLDAEDSNDLKTLWNSKHSSKGRVIAVCDVKTYKEMLEKYKDMMNPLEY